jgi:hypothetical protein
MATYTLTYRPEVMSITVRPAEGGDPIVVVPARLVLNDLHGRGLLDAGEYVIVIDVGGPSRE